MKKIFELSLLCLLSLAFLACSEDSTSPADSTPHVLTGTWEIVATFSDTTGVEQPIESLQTLNKFEVSGSKLKWTTSLGQTEEVTLEWEFTSNGNTFEIYNKIKQDNRYFGTMIDDDNFELLWGSYPVEMMQMAFPKMNKVVTAGKRKD